MGATEVTLQIVIEFVIGETHVALIAHCMPRAKLTSYDRSVSAPVLKDDHLLSIFQGLADLIDEDFREL